MPFFPPIRWVGPDGFLGQGGFPEGRIDALPRPGNAFEVIVFRQALPPEPDEDPGALPGEEVFVDGTGTAELGLGQCLPLAARPQGIDNAFEDAPGVQGFPPTPRFALIPLPLQPFPGRDQWGDFGPQLVGYGPGSICAHEERLP